MVVFKCLKLQTLDQQPVTPEERAYAQALFAPPLIPNPADTPGGGMLPALPTDRWTPGVPSPPAVTGSSTSAMSPTVANGKLFLPGKLSAMAAPAVLNYEALTQMVTNGMVGPGLQLSAASIPSIQSGTLVLSGPNAFGLEGMSLGGSSVSTGRPISGNSAGNARRLAGAAVKGIGGRRASGPAAAVAAGNPAAGAAFQGVKQPAYRGY